MHLGRTLNIGPGHDLSWELTTSMRCFTCAASCGEPGCTVSCGKPGWKYIVICILCNTISPKFTTNWCQKCLRRLPILVKVFQKYIYFNFLLNLLKTNFSTIVLGPFDTYLAGIISSAYVKGQSSSCIN